MGAPFLLMAIISILFFASGFSALVYQVVWSRLVTTLIGGSDYTIAIIVTTFMAGLGLGSKIAGAWSPRIKGYRPALYVFALLEALTAIYAIMLPQLAPLTRPMLAWFYSLSYNHPSIYHIGAFLTCVMVIMPPVLFMGATLPVLCSAVAKTLQSSRTAVPILYGINTLGAAVGALAAGFYLIYAIGLRAANYLAASIDLSVALICTYLAWRSVEGSGDEAGPVKDEERIENAIVMESSSVDDYQHHYGWSALIITFISGFTALAAEIIWTKLFGLIAGPTTFSFSGVLFCYILCLGLGSLLATLFTRRLADVMPLLLVLQLVIGMAILLSSHAIGNSSLFFAKIVYQFQDQPGLLESVKLLAIFMLISLPVTLIGLSFPLAFRAYSIAHRSIGQSIGNLYAVNTIGSVLGAGLTGFYLIPWFGMQASLSGVVLLQVVVVTLLGLPLLHARSSYKVLYAAAGVFAVWLGVHYPAWHRAHLVEGKYHRFDEQGLNLQTISFGRAFWGGREILSAHIGDLTLLYYGEGIGGFTTVTEEYDILGNRRLSMANSGKVDASSHGDIYTQALLAHLPALAKPSATNALVIGFGCGMTSGEFLHYPHLSIDSVEISPQVIAAAELFSDWNNRVLDSRRNRTIVQDARAHLALSDVTYDIITAEPSNPWMAGLAGLFTLEYLELVKSRLSPRGVFVQFVHTYQTDWETFALMVRTISEVFPRAYLFRPAYFGSDYALLCFKDPTDGLSYDAISSMIPHARNSEILTLSKPEVIYPLLITEDVRGLVGPGPLHTENLPLLELLAPRSMHHSGAAANAIIESRRRVSRETDQIMDRFRMPEYQLAFARYLASGNQHPFLVIDPDVAPPHIWEAFEDEVRRYGRDNAIFDFEIVPVDLRQLVVSVQEPLLLEERIRLLAAAELNRRRLSAVHAALVSMYQHTGRLGDMIQALLHLMLLNPDDGSLKASLASIYFSLGAYASALELLAHESVVPRDELILMKAHCLVLLNKVDQARELIRREPSYELNSAFLNLLRELD